LPRHRNEGHTAWVEHLDDLGEVASDAGLRFLDFEGIDRWQAQELFVETSSLLRIFTTLCAVV
jgi:hypothetical protein